MLRLMIWILYVIIALAGGSGDESNNVANLGKDGTQPIVSGETLEPDTSDNSETTSSDVAMILSFHKIL